MVKVLVWNSGDHGPVPCSITSSLYDLGQVATSLCFSFPSVCWELRVVPHFIDGAMKLNITDCKTLEDCGNGSGVITLHEWIGAEHSSPSKS